MIGWAAACHLEGHDGRSAAVDGLADIVPNLLKFYLRHAAHGPQVFDRIDNTRRSAARVAGLTGLEARPEVREL